MNSCFVFVTGNSLVFIALKVLDEQNLIHTFNLDLQRLTACLSKSKNTPLTLNCPRNEEDVKYSRWHHALRLSRSRCDISSEILLATCQYFFKVSLMTVRCQKLLWVRVYEGSYMVFVGFYLWSVVLARAVTDVMNRSWFEQAYFLWHVNTVYCCDKFDKQEVRIKSILNLKVQQVFKPDRYTNL